MTPNAILIFAAPDRLFNSAVLMACLILYGSPCFIASLRNHKYSWAIILVNLLLGWTLIGWIVAFLWSVTDNVKKNENVRIQFGIRQILISTALTAVGFGTLSWWTEAHSPLFSFDAWYSPLAFFCLSLVPFSIAITVPFRRPFLGMAIGLLIALVSSIILSFVARECMRVLKKMDGGPRITLSRQSAEFQVTVNLPQIVN